MAERRTPYEIYWEILVFCTTKKTLTGIINRCDLNSKTGQEYIGFLCANGYLSRITDDGKIRYLSTARAGEFITLFTDLYQKLFDKNPGFKL